MKPMIYTVVLLLSLSACSQIEKTQQKEAPSFNPKTMLLKTLEKQDDGTYVGSIYRSEIYKEAKEIEVRTQADLNALPTASVTLKGPTHDIDHMALSENGHYAVTGGPSNALIFFDLKNQNLLYKQTLENEIEAVAISKDGKFALSAIWGSGDVLYWDVLRHTVIKTIKVDKEDVYFLMFAPDEKSFYSISSRKRLIRQHDLQSGKPLKTYAGNYHRVISKDAKYAIADVYTVWNLETGKPAPSLEWHNERFDTYAFSHDGKTVVGTTTQGQIVCWDLNSGKAISHIDSGASHIHDILYTEDDRYLIMSDWHNQIYFVDLERAEVVKTFPFSEYDAYAAYVLALSEDEHFLYAGGNDNYTRTYLKKYDIQNIISLLKKEQEQKQALYAKTAKTDPDLSSLTYYRDGIYLSEKASFPDMEKIQEIPIDAIDQEVTFTKELRPKDSWSSGEDIEITMPLLSADGKFALVGSENALLYYDVSTGEMIHKFSEGVVGDIFAFTFSHDEKSALFGDVNGKIYRADLTNGTITAVFKGHRYGAQSFEFSADDRRFITASGDRTITIRDLESGELLQTLTGHTGNIRHAYLSKDDRKVISYSWYGEIRSWDVESGEGVVINGHMKGKELVRLDTEKGSIVGYFDADLEFHPYENETIQKYLLENYDAIDDFSVDADRAYAFIRNIDLLYTDLRTGQIIATFKKREASKISRDGKNGLTLHRDFSISIFNIGLEMLRSYR